MTMTEPRTMDRAEILTKLEKVNALAKAISRRGKAFQRESEPYVAAHENLDYLCACLAAQCD